MHPQKIQHATATALSTPRPAQSQPHPTLSLSPSSEKNSSTTCESRRRRPASGRCSTVSDKFISHTKMTCIRSVRYPGATNHFSTFWSSLTVGFSFYPTIRST
ncbi:hypothetical protein P153DRAFT_47826 [Dothidotthia symphoricarpi CBS 119687]|uniref:Uncharacterized protein n=1 Tax=Dothidotthia symphoricarpi CBS 119687 TaxID=1392245 RepID=A0A6A6AB42_9PLEO|nr:uncharacterized protein P153DRAFT_47826 [Dothidotthia symphoricarpi CBS 119687]KAF2128077.1 hypothetical protein P153DRAFT_47826 [Dothidotthia symphoricarpi CBS 119687]